MPNSQNKKIPASLNIIPICNWEGLLEIYKNYSTNEKKPNKTHWVFRGENKNKILETSFDRSCWESNITGDDRAIVEKEMIYEFRRKYEGSDGDFVKKDILYCLSLMRHYRAPTRLLDFTYSFFVGVFFALEKREVLNNNSNKIETFLWCVNDDWIFTKAKKHRTKPNIKFKEQTLIEKTDFNQIMEPRSSSFITDFMMNEKTFISVENPILLHERLIIQQGVFLCPGNIKKSFWENLETLPISKNPNLTILKFEMCNEERVEILKHLIGMNITNATLFPGLDGFSKSYAQRMPLLLKIAKKRKG